MSLSPTLFLIPTILAPDTAAKVLSPQVAEVIGHLDYFLAEEVRTARRFVSSLRLGRVIEQLTFYELSKKTTSTQVLDYLRELPEGVDVGVLSEAGCPGVADPGAVAVALAHSLGWRVAPLVGPSSILLALMASGFSGQSFAFQGYLPIDRAERQKAIKRLEQLVASQQQTQLFMETPFRNNQLLEALLQTCQPDSRLCIASNLTAPEEYIRIQTIAQWRVSPPNLHKKPTIFVLG